MKNTNIYKKKLNEEQQKELYIATLLHDIKTPLQAQLSSLNLLRAGRFGELKDSQKEIIDIIIESSNFMRDMLRTVLDTYRLENGVIKLQCSDVNIDELIRICINEIANFAMTYSIEIEYINTVQNPFISLDRSLFRRVLANIFNNGINYSYKNTKLLINLAEDADTIFLRIKNTGYIIPDDVKEHIFEKYYSNSDFNNKIGSGLGLYYCKRVVEAHNGKIYLNTNNDNNEFIIELNKNRKINSDEHFTFL